jgi:hypothetical protein
MQIDINKKYKTRDGREVRIYATDGEKRQPVHGAVCDNGVWLASVWLSDGKVVSHLENDSDLIEVKQRIQRTVWGNVYTNRVVPYNDRESADRLANKDRLACVKIEIDCAEGEGL